MFVQRKYIFGKLNYKEDLHIKKIHKAVKKATFHEIGVNFTVSNEKIEFANVEKTEEIETYEKGKLMVLLSTKGKNARLLEKKYDKYMDYLRNLFHRVPTLIAEIKENESETKYAQS